LQQDRPYRLGGGDEREKMKKKIKKMEGKKKRR
jgi:hypothetical protein